MQILKRTAELHNNSSVKLSGLYEIKKYRASDNRLIQHVPPFKNTITDFGLNKVGSDTCFTALFVGTGTAPAAVTDTQMGSFVAYTTAAPTYAEIAGVSPTWMHTRSVTRRFGAGVAAGNLTEVGIGIQGSNPVATNHRIWSRALIVDGAGNPITLTVLPDEYLDVTYILQAYPDLTDSNYTINISGTTHNIAARISTVGGFKGNFGAAAFSGSAVAYAGPVVLGAITGNLSGSTSNTNLNTWSNSPYADGTLKRTSTVTAGLATGNLSGGISGLRSVGSDGTDLILQNTQFTVSPVIDKTSSKILTLNREVSWSRY